MTFFLKEYDEAGVAPARGPDMQQPSTWEGIGAGISTQWRSGNVMFQRERERSGEVETLAENAARRLGIEKIRPLTQQRNRAPRAVGLSSQTVAVPNDPADAARMIGPEWSKRVIEMARQEATANPDAWADMDLTDEGVDARLLQRRMAEQADEDQISAMSNNPGFAAFAGSMIGAMADPVNIALMPFGLGGGSFLRILGKEALLGGVSEAASLPAATKTAKELDRPTPDVVETIATGVVGGAAFGAIFEGAARGLTAGKRAIEYYKARQAMPANPADPVVLQTAITAAEDAIIAGENPLRAVQDIMRLAPPEAPEPRAPLIPADAFDADPQDPGFSQGDALLGPQPAAGEAAVKAPKVAAPKRGKVAKPVRLSTFVVRNGGIFKGDDRGELAAMDYRRVGFLKAKKLERSTAGDNGGGLTIDEMRERAAEAGYLDADSTVNDFLDMLDGDVRGRHAYAREDLGLAFDMEAEARSYSAIDDYKAMEPASNGFFVNLDAYQFDDLSDDWQRNIRYDLDKYVADQGFLLTDAERGEIAAELINRGGDAQYLIERAMEREIDALEIEAQRGAASNDDNRPFAPRYEQDIAQESVDGSSRGRGGDAEYLRGSAAERTTDGGEHQAFERTDAGDQSLIAGIAPISDRQRLEQAQSARKGGGPRGPDSTIGGLFDPDDKVRVDLFSDPASQQARPMQDGVANDLRDHIEREGDFTLDLDDGAGRRSLSSVLDELDGDDEFLSILDACGKPRGNT